MSNLIDRQAAIDALAENMPSLTTPDGCGQFDHDIQVTDEAYVDCMQIIHELPSAQPGWIPCSERLPKNNGQVLVYARSVHYALAKYDEMREADGTYKKQWVTFDAWKPFYTIKDVLMWMPLPAPFREWGQE